MGKTPARDFGLPLVTHEGRISVMRELYREGDVARALMVAAVIETALEATREVTLEEDASTQRTLVHHHSGMRPTSVLAPDCVLRVAKAPTDIAKLPLDHRVGFILAHVDGITTVESILDVSAMPHDEALSLLHELLVLGIVQVV